MWLTWSRVLACPPLVLTLMSHSDLAGWIGVVIFIIAAITDYYDGNLARRFGVESNLGRFMDPIADKVLVTSALLMLIPVGRVGPILVLILVVRDILVGGIRAVAAADNVIISAKATGKWKTGIQMVAVPCLFIEQPIFGLPLNTIGLIALWISAVLSVVSGIEYSLLYYRSRSA